MKVLTTTLCYPTPESPQQGIFVQRRAAALVQRTDVTLEVVTPRPWCPILRRRPCGLARRRPLRTSYPRMISVPVLNWATDGLAFARVIRKFVAQKRYADRRNFDLIDAHFVYPDGVGAWLAGRALGIPVVVTIRGKIVSLSRRTIRRLQIQAMLRSVDARIAVSESLAVKVRQLAGSDLSVDVIPNGVDTSMFYSVDRVKARRALGWDLNARYVLSVGHLQRLKGFDRLVDLLPAVRACAGDVRLVLAGSERGERRFAAVLNRRVKEINTLAYVPKHQPCISFIGEVPGEQLNLMYGAADVCVNASRSEGWNNAISESLAAGTPVVATEVGGNSEQIGSSELGTIVPNGDATALSVAIVTALSREWNRPLIAAHGSARSWDHVASEVHTVFQRVLTERAATRSEAAEMPSQERMIEVPG